MDDEYPRLLVDRDVMVVRNGDQTAVRLRGWDLDPAPISEAYGLELSGAIGRFEATGPDMFEALVELRRQLERLGWLIALQGARLDAYPSGMARDMGGGLRIYLVRPGAKASFDHMVNTLDDADGAQVVTVDAQKTYWNAWRGSHAARRASDN